MQALHQYLNQVSSAFVSQDANRLASYLRLNEYFKVGGMPNRALENAVRKVITLSIYPTTIHMLLALFFFFMLAKCTYL